MTPPVACARREKLTDVAHQRKAAAQKKAAELEAKKAAEAEAAAIALAAKRAQLDGKRSEVADAAQQGTAAAQSKLDADRASGTLDEALEANASVAEEELMVLEAIFGEEAFERDMDESLPTFTLLVTECNGKGEETRVKLRITMVAEYPSHLPPGVEVLEGVDADDRTFVCDSLRALFYRERAEVGEEHHRAPVRAAELVDALFKNAAVHGLELSNCSLGDAGARSIAGLLRKGYGGEGAAYQPQLTTLDLSDNAIGIEGARALSCWGFARP